MRSLGDPVGGLRKAHRHFRIVVVLDGDGAALAQVRAVMGGTDHDGLVIVIDGVVHPGQGGAHRGCVGPRAGGQRQRRGVEGVVRGLRGRARHRQQYRLCGREGRARTRIHGDRCGSPILGDRRTVHRETQRRRRVVIGNAYRQAGRWRHAQAAGRGRAAHRQALVRFVDAVVGRRQHEAHRRASRIGGNGQGQRADRGVVRAFRCRVAARAHFDRHRSRRRPRRAVQRAGHRHRFRTVALLDQRCIQQQVHRGRKGRRRSLVGYRLIGERRRPIAHRVFQGFPGRDGIVHLDAGLAVQDRRADRQLHLLATHRYRGDRPGRCAGNREGRCRRGCGGEGLVVGEGQGRAVHRGAVRRGQCRRPGVRRETLAAQLVEVRCAVHRHPGRNPYRDVTLEIGIRRHPQPVGGAGSREVRAAAVVHLDLARFQAGDRLGKTDGHRERVFRRVCCIAGDGSDPGRRGRVDGCGDLYDRTAYRLAGSGARRHLVAVRFALDDIAVRVGQHRQAACESVHIGTVVTGDRVEDTGLRIPVVGSDCRPGQHGLPRTRCNGQGRAVAELVPEFFPGRRAAAVEIVIQGRVVAAASEIPGIVRRAVAVGVDVPGRIDSRIVGGRLEARCGLPGAVSEGYTGRLRVEVAVGRRAP